MTVVLIGASGNAGSRILRELQSRGHDVTAVVRNTEKLPANVKKQRDDLSTSGHIREIISGADALVSAYNPPDNDPDQLIRVTGRLIEAVKKAEVARFVMVGGAACLEIAPGMTALA